MPQAEMDLETIEKELDLSEKQHVNVFPNSDDDESVIVAHGDSHGDQHYDSK